MGNPAILKPQDVLPSEQFLGLMMKDKRAREYGLTLPPGVMRDPFHREIFETIRRTDAQGHEVSAQSITAALGDHPGFESTRPDYLNLMALAAPVTVGVERLVEMLREETGLPGRTIYDLHSTASLGAIAATDYLIKGLITPGELSVFYGEPGCGKSFLACFLAYMIALGRSVGNRRVRRAPVIVTALEGQAGFPRRISALQDRFGKAENFYWIAQPADLYSGEGNVEGLIDAILKVDAKLLVIDTLARAMGAGSENDGRDMGLVLANLDLIKRETGAHVSLIHHCGKDAARGMRGHSSLLGGADVAAEVKRQSPGPRTLKVVKSKDAADGDELAFDLEVIELGQDDDGDAITTCVVVPSSEPPGQAKPRVTGKAKLALELLIRAINDAGQPPPSGANFPRDKHVVPLTLWRQYVYQGSGTERDTSGTSRKAFTRARELLQNRGLVGIWGDFVWLL